MLLKISIVGDESHVDLKTIEQPSLKEHLFMLKTLTSLQDKIVRDILKIECDYSVGEGPERRS